MNISIEKKEFSTAVHTVSRFAERKSGTLPALSAILIVAGDDGIKLRATNLEAGADLKIKGNTLSDGVVAIPAHVLLQIASSFTNEGAINLEHTGDTVTITTNTGKSIVKTVPYDDFPSISFPENPKNNFTLPGTLLKNIFTSLAPYASPSTVRPELSSIHITIEGGVLTAVTTDSFRLVEKKIPLSNKGTQGKFLIPAKNAIDIAQALPDTEIQMSFDDHQCAFVGDVGILVSRLTNAVYPDYRQILPKEFVAEAIVLRKDLESALKHTTIFSDSFQKIHLQLNTKKNTLSVSAKNTDVGEASEIISGKISGEEIALSFNHRYLSSSTSLTGAESLSLKISGIGRPMVVTGIGDTSLLYLISPMNQ
jgi:DNA polymerase III subunit beta